MRARPCSRKMASFSVEHAAEVSIIMLSYDGSSYLFPAAHEVESGEWEDQAVWSEEKDGLSVCLSVKLPCNVEPRWLRASLDPCCRNRG